MIYINIKNNFLIFLNRKFYNNPLVFFKKNSMIINYCILLNFLKKEKLWDCKNLRSHDL